MDNSSKASKHYLAILNKSWLPSNSAEEAGIKAGQFVHVTPYANSYAKGIYLIHRKGQSYIAYKKELTILREVTANG